MRNPAVPGGVRSDDQDGTSLPSLRQRNQVTRTTLRELDQAACVDCGQQWTNPAPFLDATRHVREVGHTVVVATARVWQYSPADGAP